MSKKIKSLIEENLKHHAKYTLKVFKDAHERGIMFELCNDIVDIAREDSTLDGYECINKAAIRNDL